MVPAPGCHVGGGDRRIHPTGGGALRQRRLRDRGADRPGQRDHDRVGGSRRAALPARDPSRRRGGVAPRGILAWAGPGDRGGCRRAGVRIHDRRPRPHRQHLRAGERGLGAGHGAAGLHPPPHDGGATRRGGRRHGAERANAGRRVDTVGDIEVQTAVEPAGDGRFTAHGARRLGDLGPVRRVRGRPGAAGGGNREPLCPARQLLLPLPLGGRLRAGRSRGDPAAGGPHRVGPACRHDPGGATGARGHGLVRR